MPFFKLPSLNLLTMIGFLGIVLRAANVLKEDGILKGADILKGAEREPLGIDTKASESAGLRVESWTDDVGVAALKTSRVTSTTNLLARKANRVSLRSF